MPITNWFLLKKLPSHLKTQFYMPEKYDSKGTLKLSIKQIFLCNILSLICML